jgi:hypothetical protein
MLHDICESWPHQEMALPKLTGSAARRTTPLGGKVLQFLHACTASMQEQALTWIVSSRYGDVEPKINLLTDLSRGEMASPTDFSLSVHNAIIGTFSIATQNMNTYSALAGGCHSFEMGLLEALAHLVERGGKIGYLYYDEERNNQPCQDLPADPPAQVVCWAALLAVGTAEISIEYQHAAAPAERCAPINLKKLIEFFTNDSRRYVLPCASGEILLQRAK